MKVTSTSLSRALWLGLLGLALICALTPEPASAQAVSGTILGTVKDGTGAAVPGASVTLSNTDTGLTRTVTTDSAGEYSAPQVPTGTYSVKAELTGFKTVTTANIHVGVDQKVRIDMKLEVGTVSEAITIQAEAPLVQTSSSELGATVNEIQIKTLPLNGRNFVSLTRTVPGVLRGIPGANIDGAGSLAWRASASFSANGQRPRDNNFMLDGIDNNETWLQTVVIFPSVEALDEFKMQTSTYSAEFGRSLGGVVNIQIKSGTNNLHGNVFDFARNDALDANNFFNNRAGRPKPDFSQHQFGATLGGPIIKDKTFFFADYQGQRITAGQTYLSTVPSDRMRVGDFSEVNRVIYDPLTGQPFPGNIIPISRMDPASRNIIEQMYPKANTAGTRGSTGQFINNYLINPSLERQDNQFDVKLNHTLSPSNSFFIRYSYEKTHRFLPATLPIGGDQGVTFGAGDGNIKAQGVAFNDTHSFSSKWLNELRLGWGSVDFLLTPLNYGENWASKVGIPGINLNETTSGMTQIVFSNGGARNMGQNGNQPLITNINNYQIFDNITRVNGKHTTKAGGSLTLRSREVLNADTIVGQWSFNQNMTSNCAGQLTGCTLNSATGIDVASFMLGYATTATRNLFDAKTYTETRPEWAVYAQDDFRATSKLTLNYGVRWDVFVPWVEQDNLQSNYDPSIGRFIVASDSATIKGVQVGRTLQTYSKGDVGPRFGFAYDMKGNGKTILRGGVGVYWNFSPGGTSSSKAQNQPFLQTTSLANNTFGTNVRLSGGLPAPPGVDPTKIPVGTTRSVFDINFRDAYTTNFNVNWQQQLGHNYMFEIAYVGSRARQVMIKTDYNQAPPTLGVTNANTLRPSVALGAPGLTTLGAAESSGFMNYNGLLVKFVRRFANGFSFFNSYTMGKAVDITSDNDGTVTLTNIFNPMYNSGPADYDIHHTLSSNWIYELPIARNTALGGWQVSGILYYRTGLPQTITQTQGVLSTGTGNRPNLTGQPLDNPDQTIDHWWNPAGFTAVTETTATYGNAGRGIGRAPGQFNIDASLIKNTRFGRYNLEIRAEAFNVLNHPQFGNPNSTFGNAAFGQITSMLANPACSLCGTTERNIQLSAKFSF